MNKPNYPECSGDSASCPENEGFGCCKPNATPQPFPAPAAQSGELPELPTPWGYARNVDGRIQVSVGPERPPCNERGSGYFTPWAAMYGGDQMQAYARQAIAQTAPAVAGEAWLPIETAPKGAKGYSWMRLAWGPDDDKCTGEGMRFGDKFYVAAYFYCMNQERKYQFREIEVTPTHWLPKTAAPTQGAKQ